MASTWEAPAPSKLPEPKPTHWRGLRDDRDYGNCIFEVNPWPPVSGIRGTTRLVARDLEYKDADRILKAVGGEWSE